ncbi:hypothetical protein FXO38_21388 [Capsicum annuum]|nr:hypothetical protein FXO38_21388 [Capsicum annuum]
MAGRVGFFLWDDTQQAITSTHEDYSNCTGGYEHIFTNLDASTSTGVRKFIKQLLEIYLDILIEYLNQLPELMLNDISTRTPVSRNIHLMKEFLLINLIDVANNFIHHDKLFDLLTCVRELSREI